MKISKEDWKLFKQLLPEWQENYIEKLNEKYIKLLQRHNNASTNFWDLYHQMHKDIKLSGVTIAVRKSDVALDLAKLLNESVITQKELKPFSAELKKEVQQI